SWSLAASPRDPHQMSQEPQIDGLTTELLGVVLPGHGSWIISLPQQMLDSACPRTGVRPPTCPTPFGTPRTEGARRCTRHDRPGTPGEVTPKGSGRRGLRPAADRGRDHRAGPQRPAVGTTKAPRPGCG